MKEVSPDKGLYTEEEFAAAMSDNRERHSVQDSKTKKEKVEDLAEMSLDGDDVLREGDTFVDPEVETETEVFTELESRQIDTITLMRIYDVLGAILNHLDEDACTALMEKHAQGGLQGPPPSLNI